MRHDRRIVLLSLLAGAPGMAAALALLWFSDVPTRAAWSVAVVLVGAWAVLTVMLRNRIIRPLQTLANMIAALREGDFSIRARVLDERDPLSLVHLEVNQLEGILREQRLGAVEATELLRKVLEEVDLAIFAFDEEEKLRLVNRAGESLLGQSTEKVVGKGAEELHLSDALRGAVPRTIELMHTGGAGRWEVRRSKVRQEGLPLNLLVLSDLSRALREEERLMWKRIIRVLSHEINNSLAPIKSISDSLASLIERNPAPADLEEDMTKGLKVIQSRSEALGRFMSTYATLARLPPPTRVPVDLTGLVRRVAQLERRLPVEVRPGPDMTIQADRDQLEQALINVLRNAVDANLEMSGGPVVVSWATRDDSVQLVVEDEGPGISDTANLFVPFYTTKSGGSGIGLALSRQIAEGHGGSLDLENLVERRGARARLVLPTG